MGPAAGRQAGDGPHEHPGEERGRQLGGNEAELSRLPGVRESLLARMLKKAPNFVLTTHCTKPSNGYSSNPSTYRTKPTGGKVTLRSHLIEASGSSESKKLSLLV